MRRGLEYARTLTGVLFSAVVLMSASGAEPVVPGPVTVAQLEHMLSAAHGEQDKKLAREISGMQLTERLSLSELARLENDLPGPHARAALTAIADASAFLMPPTAEIPVLAAPDRQAVVQMVAQALDYVIRIRPKLPDFSARRNTTHFEVTTPQRILHEHQQFQFLQMEDTSLQLHQLGPVSETRATGVRLFLVGNWTEVVTYRDGKEVKSTSDQNSRGTNTPAVGLTTSGEFGPILSVAMGDAARGEMKWDHWEQGTAGALAVFRYSVPKDASHFAISERSTDWLGIALGDEYPAYHGEIVIDPTDGTVYRITMKAMPNEDETAEILVDYAATSIGGKSYVCPVRGVAISVIPESNGTARAPDTPVDVYMNDIVFTNYHLFRSESRIILDGKADQ
jgi:hypothetical protein